MLVDYITPRKVFTIYKLQIILYVTLLIVASFFCSIEQSWQSMLILTISLIATVILHETLHAILLIRRKGKIKFGIATYLHVPYGIYVTASNIAITKDNIIRILLVPQLLTWTLWLTSLILATHHINISTILLLCAIANLGGSVSDIFTAVYIKKRHQDNAIFQDTQHGINVYTTESDV